MRLGEVIPRHAVVITRENRYSSSPAPLNIMVRKKERFGRKKKNRFLKNSILLDLPKAISVFSSSVN